MHQPRVQLTAGFTVLELLVSFAIVGILLVALLNVFNMKGTVTYGINGIVEVRCINGYLFTIGQGSEARQVLDEFGKGARCTENP